tara:strand:+ start:1024 stop:1173 length:150 start_codon:yes stop_codon:yes gene_type:complete
MSQNRDGRRVDQLSTAMLALIWVGGSATFEVDEARFVLGDSRIASRLKT